jgi:hypothetical protein
VVQRAIGVLEALGASVTNVHLPRAAEARAILSALAPETVVDFIGNSVYSAHAELQQVARQTP